MESERSRSREAGSILPVTDQFLVLTPEKVVVSYRVCGLATRVGAHAIDFVLAFIASIAASTAVAVFGAALGEIATSMLGALAFAVTMLGYFVMFEGFWRGQTPGKVAFRTRVMMYDGTPVTFAAALYRNLLRPADFLPAFYLVGLLSMFTNAKAQRLGDLAAGTVVVVERGRDLGYVPAPHHAGIHRMESSVGDLSKMSLDEYQAIKRLVERFPTLPYDTREWSIGAIWVPFAAKHGIEPVPGVHPLFQMEAVVMKFGRVHNLV